MKKVVFDFNQIPDLSAFYADFSRQFALDDHFGGNLDALWDELTGNLPLPLDIEFINLTSGRRRHFGALMLVFEEAEDELNGDLRFTILDKPI
jgi:ribonuclease inhibitor